MKKRKQRGATETDAVFDRRELVKLGSVGAAAFLEGCRRREEAFIVQPLTRSGMPGEARYRNLVCQQCPAGCQAELRVIDREAKKLEGMPSGAVNRGGLCALGQSSLQEHYHPDRLLRPMVRTGERGLGLEAFEAVSWQQALERVGESLSRRSGAAAIVARPDNGFVDALWRDLASRVGSPPPTFLRPFDEAVEREAARIALGIDGLPVYDLANSDLILSFGAPFLDRWRSPVHYAASLTEARSRHKRARLVQIEARQSLAGVAADLWLPARAGSEGVLARAFAGELLANGSSGPGAAGYRRLFPAPPPTLAETAEVCDLPLARLQQVAAALRAAERPVVLAGGLAVAGGDGLSVGVAVLALNLLFDLSGDAGGEARGGVFAPADFSIDDPSGGSLGGGPEETPLARLASRLRGEAGPKTELLIVAEADPLFVAPGGWQLDQAMAELDTIVYLGIVLNDTALHADVLLPLESDLERFHAVRPSPSLGRATLLLAESAAEPIGEGRHPGDVALALGLVATGRSAEEVEGLDSFRERTEGAVTRALASATGASGDAGAARRAYNDALEAGSWVDRQTSRRRPRGPLTRADLNRGALLESSVREVVDDPAANRGPGLRPDGFLLLPVETVKASADGRGAERPWLQELPDAFSTVMWDSWIEVAAADARQLGIEMGHRVRVSSASDESSSAEVTAVIAPALRPGTVAMPLGLGHRPRGLYVEGTGTNVYRFLTGDVVEGTEVPALVGARVKLEPLGPPERKSATPIYGRGLHQSEAIPAGWAPARESGHAGAASKSADSHEGKAAEGGPTEAPSGTAEEEEQ